MIYTLKNTIDVGRPVRAFCDGSFIERCVYADTEAGVAEAIKYPHKIKKDGSLETVKIYGKITVEPKK